MPSLSPLVEGSDVSRVLVTGGSGFVGKRLLELLPAHSFSGVGTTRREYSSPLIPVGEIGPDTDWSAVLNGCRSVVHLAARVHLVQDRAVDPLDEYRRVNVVGTEQLAREASAAGVEQFVFISTVKVLGEWTREGRPFTDNSPVHPLDPYSQSKWEAELVLNRVASETGLKVIILRPPLVYGPHVKANFFSLLEKVKLGYPLPLGRTTARRTMCFVDNLASAIIAALKRTNVTGTFLVADSETLLLRDCVAKLAAEFEVPLRLLPLPPRLLELACSLIGKREVALRLTQSLEVDSTGLHAALGWHPPYSTDEGLALTAQWFKRNYSSS